MSPRAHASLYCLSSIEIKGHVPRYFTSHVPTFHHNRRCSNAGVSFLCSVSDLRPACALCFLPACNVCADHVFFGRFVVQNTPGPTPFTAARSSPSRDRAHDPRHIPGPKEKGCLNYDAVQEVCGSHKHFTPMSFIVVRPSSFAFLVFQGSEISLPGEEA